MKKEKYESIIGFPHHISGKRPQMSIHDRASQFAPFAALTGLGAEMYETARLTDEKTELDENAKEILNAALVKLSENIDRFPEAAITYFLPDRRKAGGKYITVSGSIRKIDCFEKTVLMNDGTLIPIENIYSIAGIQNYDAEEARY